MLEIVVFLVVALIQVAALAVVGIVISGTEKRNTTALKTLNDTQERQYLESLQLYRADALKNVHVEESDVMETLARILSAALCRPMRLRGALSVSILPVPAAVLDCEAGEEVILTTSGESYLKQVLIPSRRVSKRAALDIVSILPDLSQLVVDEELYQCFEHLAASFRQQDADRVPHVQKWQILCLPMDLKETKGNRS